jgi:3-(3-hydroxy-phenyl)propionate hydroxylase
MKNTSSQPYAAAQHTNGYEFSQGTGYTLPEYDAVIPDAVKSGEIEHHRILIVGGGLTGLTLACSLAQLGVKCVLLDEDNTVGVKGASSRGICYTQKSLEIFDKLGIYERIKAKGIQWSVGRTFAGEDEVYNFDLKAQGNFSLSEQPAFANIQQFYNEGFLVERIFELGHAQIRWNNRVTAFSIENKFATFSIATPAGSYKATADFIVDATGSRSPFHDWLNIEKTIKKGDDRWCIADVRFNTHPPKERHTWIEAPFNENRAVWQHLMADDVWRIDYQMAPDADPAYVSSETQVRERLARQFGAETKVDIVWVGPYAYRSECVNAMAAKAGKSEVFFIGDSAKVVSPFGARGGNTGIADADNLAWKLAAVVQGRASSRLLQSYHAERHEAATTNVQVTNRTARFLRPAQGMERVFRDATIHLAKKHLFARSLVNTGRMAVANPYSRSPITAPDLAQSHSVQNVSFQWANRHTGHLNDLLRWAAGLPLLLLWHAPQSRLASLLMWAQAGRVRMVHVGELMGSLPASEQPARFKETIQDPERRIAPACGFAGAAGWALIRPDSYLAARGAGLDVRAIELALARLQGASRVGASV